MDMFHILVVSSYDKEPASDALNETADCNFLTDVSVSQRSPSSECNWLHR